MNLDYVAGFLDGEGCIQLVKTTQTISVEISQASRPVLDNICELTGIGGVYLKKKYNPEHKQMYHWVATGITAIEFLENIIEKLIVKKEQALLVIANKHLFQRHRKKLSDETKAGRERLRLQLKELKRI